MIGLAAKMLAYKTAPKATYAVMHPFKAAKYGAIYMVMKRVMGRSRAGRA